MAAWFGPKRIGFGVSPRSWQGWLATGLLVVAVITARAVFRHGSWPHWAAPAVLATLVALYFGVTALTYNRQA